MYDPFQAIVNDINDRMNNINDTLNDIMNDKKGHNIMNDIEQLSISQVDYLLSCYLYLIEFLQIGFGDFGTMSERLRGLGVSGSSSAAQSRRQCRRRATTYQVPLFLYSVFFSILSVCIYFR